ncbi:hypothetical protein HJC99_01775 [Candidatus Saccharibacteria bacterium]|nr:hypothetical protein [Candidatus Saccharibacteria bacterium]
MFVLASHLTALPVISLQTGETIATVSSLVIDSGRLRLVGFQLDAGRSPRTLLVMTSVRQLATDCIIVNDDDELSEPDDVVRFKPLLKEAYNPSGSHVQTESGHHLGTVEEYTINLDSEDIQKVYVKPPFLRAWYSSSLIIDRTQIIDVAPTRIIVSDTYLGVPSIVEAGAHESS